MGELTRPGTPVHWAVLNVSGGPGIRPDPHCLEAAGRLTNAGVRVLGHLDVTYGARPHGELISEAHRYLDWYRVDGFFLDRCPTERAALPEIRRITTTLRALLASGHIVLGHGRTRIPDTPRTATSWSRTPAPGASTAGRRWPSGPPTIRRAFCHFVHGVPRRHLEEALRIARWQGAGTIWFTDRYGRGGRTDPWESLPGYWDEIVSRIGPGVSE